MSIGDEIPEGFHHEFGSWARIEPAARSDDLARGIEAPCADALWMIGRQWQTGELQAEDAGSPVSAQLSYSTQSFDSLPLGDGEPQEPPSDMPLETAIEREAWRIDWRWRIRIGQFCERYIRSLDQSNEFDIESIISQLRVDYPVPMPQGEDALEIDAATRKFLQMTAGRAIDGAALHDALLEGSTGVSEEVEVEDIVLDALKNKLFDWLGELGFPRKVVESIWLRSDSELETTFDPPAAKAEAWRNRQLDYRFEVNAPGEHPDDDQAPLDRARLIAPNYRSGALDWYSFDSLSETNTQDADPANAPWASKSATVYPTRISVGGTSPRWWAFEDAATDFGALDVATTDLAKLLLMEFVLIYGDDWFSVPLTAQMPELVRLDELKIFNAFGEELSIPSVRTKTRARVLEENGNPDNPVLRWELFSLSPHEPRETGATALTDVLVLPPVVGIREESRPLEEVHFLRDEGANRVWGVEHTITDGIGRPIRGFDAQRSRFQRRREALERTVEDFDRRLKEEDLSEADRADLEEYLAKAKALLARMRPPKPSSDAVPRYLLATEVPDNWIPFNPVRSEVLTGQRDPSIRLQRARMLRYTGDSEPEHVHAQTRVLSLASPDPLLWLDEEVVTRAGVHLQLTAQRTRWVDGKTHVWLGRKVRTGKGEGSSGLRYDHIRNDSGVTD